MKRNAASAIVFLLSLAIWSPPAAASPVGPPPFITSAPAELVSLVNGLSITPLLTTGDVIGGRLGGFQFTGVPDGIGTYVSSPGRLEVFVNHELSANWGDPTFARVSHLSLDGSGGVVSASYAIDGSQGYEWFCSGTMANAGGIPWWLTGEEWARTDHRGMAVAINAVTGRVLETPQFGHLSHENLVPISGLDRSVIFLSEDGQAGHSQIYAYVAKSLTAALRGNGTFRTWVPDDQGDGDPSTNDIGKGDSVAGRLVRVPGSADVGGLRLDAAASAVGAMDFVRIEDAVSDPAHPGVLYFSDTGTFGRESRHGRVYRLTVDPAHPLHATLEVVLDGDDGDDITNPDNLGISDRALAIQEDRNATASGYNRVLVYDLASGTLTAVARTDPTPLAIKHGGGPGAWESSGVVDVSDVFGQGYWLLDVEAHYTKVLQQGARLEVDSAVGEGGQLLLVYLPGT